jgi:hypothetical protein
VANKPTPTLQSILTNRTERRAWDLMQSGTPLDQVASVICAGQEPALFVITAINRLTDKILEHNAARHNLTLDGGRRYPDPMPGPCACHPEGGS